MPLFNKSIENYFNNCKDTNYCPYDYTQKKESPESEFIMDFQSNSNKEDELNA